MTGHIYRDFILEQHVRLFRGTMGAEFLFMDDNTRPHRAKQEHVWDMLGRRIAARQPPPTCLSELRRALLDEWCNIPQDQIDNLILSMPRRFYLYTCILFYDWVHHCRRASLWYSVKVVVKIVRAALDVVAKSVRLLVVLQPSPIPDSRCGCAILEGQPDNIKVFSGFTRGKPLDLAGIKPLDLCLPLTLHFHFCMSHWIPTNASNSIAEL
ncbi:kelch-like protein 20 [Trichonephila clavipes]|nr:kelch-like protein 20 [Trichonephila clavipes]